MNDMSMTRAETPPDRSPRHDRDAEIELRIGGMDCPHCPANVEEALREIAGVSHVHVNLANGSAHVVYDPSRVKVLDLIKAIRDCGLHRGCRVDARWHQEHALLVLRDQDRAGPADHARRDCGTRQLSYQRRRHRVRARENRFLGNPGRHRIDRLSRRRRRQADGSHRPIPNPPTPRSRRGKRNTACSCASSGLRQPYPRR